MTNIEMDVARSTINKNKALVRSLETINWEQRRYEIAKDMLTTTTEMVCDVLRRGGKVEGGHGETIMQMAAERAVWYADALVEELNKKKTDEKE